MVKFERRNKKDLPQGIKEKPDEKAGAVEQLDYLYHECERAGQKVYLFINEYDHFTNAILSDADSLRRYTEETHKEVYLRAFFSKIDAGISSGIYADIFLCPLLGIYPDMKHCYIIELKYAKYKDPETYVEELRRQAVAQVNRYADTDRVKNAVGSTQFHKIVVVYKGMEKRVCEEVD